MSGVLPERSLLVPPSRAELLAELELLEAERDSLVLELERVRRELEWTD